MSAGGSTRVVIGSNCIGKLRYSRRRGYETWEGIFGTVTLGRPQRATKSPVQFAEHGHCTTRVK